MQQHRMRVEGSLYKPRAIAVRRVSIKSVKDGRPKIIVTVACAPRIPKKNSPATEAFEVVITFRSMGPLADLLDVVRTHEWAAATCLLDSENRMAGIFVSAGRVFLFKSLGPYGEYDIVEK